MLLTQPFKDFQMLCAPSCQNTQALIFVFASKWRFDARAVRSRSGSLVSGFVFFLFFSLHATPCLPLTNSTLLANNKA